jgi:hypothetical protein
MLCAGGGLLITAGTLLTIYESVRRPQTINITREFEERIASGKITTLRVGGGRSGLVLIAIGAALLAVAATTTAQTG